jgi:hypothetical protein
VELPALTLALTGSRRPMESKGCDAKHAGEADTKADVPTKNLVMRFCEYAFKVLNQDMDDFFEDNMDAFEQVSSSYYVILLKVI